VPSHVLPMPQQLYNPAQPVSDLLNNGPGARAAPAPALQPVKLVSKAALQGVKPPVKLPVTAAKTVVSAAAAANAAKKQEDAAYKAQLEQAKDKAEATHAAAAHDVGSMEK